MKRAQNAACLIACLTLLALFCLSACRSESDLLSDYDLFAEGHASWRNNRLKGERMVTVLRSLGLEFTNLRPVCFTPGQLAALSYRRTTGSENQRVYLWLEPERIRTSQKMDWNWEEIRSIRLQGLTVMRLDKDGREHSAYIERLRREQLKNLPSPPPKE